jgi:hypothetical protein
MKINVLRALSLKIETIAGLSRAISIREYTKKQNTHPWVLYIFSPSKREHHCFKPRRFCSP